MNDNLEGSGRGLLEELSQRLPGMPEENERKNQDNRILAEVRTRELPKFKFRALRM
jgi:hypothetical protein